jgi:hypothetical protein
MSKSTAQASNDEARTDEKRKNQDLEESERVDFRGLSDTYAMRGALLGSSKRR